MKFKLHGNINKKVVLAVGEWDPLSYNHFHLFDFLIERATKKRANSCIILIQPRPVDFILNKEVSHYYNDIAFIIHKILEYGIDGVLEATFENKEDALGNATTFIPMVLEYVKIFEIWLGLNQSIGQNEHGNQKTIRDIGKLYKYMLKLIPNNVFKYNPKKLNEKDKLKQLIDGGFTFNKQIVPFAPTYYIKNKNKIFFPFKNGQYKFGLKTALTSRTKMFIQPKVKNNYLTLQKYHSKNYDWLIVVRGPP